MEQVAAAVQTDYALTTKQYYDYALVHCISTLTFYRVHINKY